MCDVPSTAVYCGSTECVPGVASSSFFTNFVTIPLAPIVTSIITYFMFHIRCVSTHKLLDLLSFCFLLSDVSLRKYCHIYQCGWFLFYPFNYFIWPIIILLIILLLLLTSLPSSSSSSPLCRVFILIFLRQSMSLGNTVLQLFWCYYSRCLYR